MLKYYSLLYIFFVINCKQGLAQVTAAPGKTYAVVIGISTYKNKALPSLQYSDKDAKLFAFWLQSKAGGNVPATQIKLLLNEEATIAAVYNALDWLKENCKSDDLGYIYFSGHGDVETKNTFSLGYLLAYNTPPNNYRNNAIRIEDLNNKANILSLKNKAKVILITDACHAGKLAGDFYKGKQLVASQLRVVLNNEVRLASCAADEEAAEGPDWGGGHGVFSYYLLMGLNGRADLKKNGTIQLAELNKFLDSSFVADKFLLADKHQQHPITDGNPNFLMAITDTETLNLLGSLQQKNDSATAQLPAGMQSFKAIGLQPIDYFFALSQVQPIENYIDFDLFSKVLAEALPLKILDERIHYQQLVDTLVDSLFKAGQDYYGKDVANLDSLKLLRAQLLKNKSLNARFNERFIEMVHNKGQDMINAYLDGDLAELEKRQYYYSGNREYSYFLSMLKVAIHIAPANHSLAGLLKVNYSYLAGLIDRLGMATGRNTDSSLNRAFIHQREALQLEPYAAYIHNELGNLYLHIKSFDSAAYHFNLANALSPTWAVPWSNKIRLSLAINKPAKAKEAIHIADSLQPNLAYVMMNTGLVMEQENNWLAAESFYKKAIAKNSVHFFPYEHLGKIYLLTGEYQKADMFFFEAKIRKGQFAINDDYFKFGIELSGSPPSKSLQQQHLKCNWKASIATKKIAQPYIILAKALMDSLPINTIVSLLNDALQQAPDIPLAHHYLGQQLYHQGKLQQAEAALLKAVAKHPTDDKLWVQLREAIYPNNAGITDTCLLQSLASYQYDILEDHCLLGSLYEKQSMTAKAIAQYSIISAIENERQLGQANFVGFDAKAYELQPNPRIAETVLAAFERPINMGGAIKAARLYEKLGKYLPAEKILLNQVLLNRAAGNKRQDTILSRKPGAWQIVGKGINFYWLAINHDMESETYNFYQRMMLLFPRDFEWKEKAGLFLYNRLALAFNQMQVAEYQPFYASMGKYAYPWRAGEDWIKQDDIIFELPGTLEKVQIKMPVYDPLKQALEYLQQSVKLSGEVNPRAAILEPLAGLNNWIGNSETSIQQYKALLKLTPGNGAARNKLIARLVANFEYPDACVQLSLAKQLGQIIAKQLLLLAEYKMLGNNFREATETLKIYVPQSNAEKCEVMALYAKNSWLNGDPATALTYLLDSFPIIKIDTKDDNIDYNINADKQKMIVFRLYSIARMYSMLKNNDTAFVYLKQSLDAGLNYKYVLDNDTIWAAVRNTQKWNTLIKNYDFKVDYLTQPTKTPRPLKKYKVPNYHN